MLVRDLFWRASLALNDFDPQFVHWSASELVAWANDGQRVIAKYLPPAAARLDAVKLAPGAFQRIDTILAANVKPGDGSAPADVKGMALFKCYQNMGTDGLTPGHALRIVSGEALDAAQSLWMAMAPTNRVTEYAFDPRIPTVYQVYPPADGTGWVRIGYQAEPIDIPEETVAGEYARNGASTRHIGIAAQYADDLLNYILARAVLKDAELGLFPLAQGYIQLFTASINAQAEALTGNNPNLSVLPLAPAPAAVAS